MQNGPERLFVRLSAVPRMPCVSWERDARCNDYDPEIFFDPRVRFERKAKSICGRCDVRANCLAYALQTRIEFGVWGGMNGKERRALLRGPVKVADLHDIADKVAVGV
jgi:WhiB family transcriptional regulator, redox-sensing transcriptional regulator